MPPKVKLTNENRFWRRPNPRTTRVKLELKTLGIHPRRAMEQIVDYKHDPGNGYAKTHRKGLMPQLIPAPEKVAA